MYVTIICMVLFAIAGVITARQTRLGADVTHFSQRMGFDPHLGIVGILWFGAAFAVAFGVGWEYGPFEDHGSQMTPTTVGYTLGILLAGAGPFGLILAISHWNRFRLVNRATKQPTGIARPGVAIVHGTVEKADETIESPFGSVECVCYEFYVEEHDLRTGTTSRGRSIRVENWEIIDAGREYIPFVVTDGTGPVYVAPENVWFDIGPRDAFPTPTVESDADESPPERISAFIERRETVQAGNNLPGSESPPDRRYYEETVCLGDNVTVVGNIRRGKHDEPVMVVDGDNPGGMIVSDASPEELIERIRSYVVWGGPGGIIATCAGILLMAFINGFI